MSLAALEQLPKTNNIKALQTPVFVVLFTFWMIFITDEN
jgi:hypothetical protein